MNLDNWMSVLLTDAKSIRHLHVLERKFGFENNDFEVLLESRGSLYSEVGNLDLGPRREVETENSCVRIESLCSE